MKMQEILNLLHFLFLKLQNEIMPKSSTICDGIFMDLCEKVRKTTEVLALLRLMEGAKDGRLWKNLLILLTTLRKKFGKYDFL